MSSLLWQINAYATLMTLSLNAFEMLFWSMQPHFFKPQYVNIPCPGINTLRTRQNGCHVAADILKCISMNENVWILNNMSLKCIPWDLIRNMSAFVQVMAWPLTGTTPLPEPMMTLVTDASGVLKKHFGQSRAHGYLVYNAVVYNESHVVLYISMGIRLQLSAPLLHRNTIPSPLTSTHTKGQMSVISHKDSVQHFKSISNKLDVNEMFSIVLKD